MKLRLLFYLICIFCTAGCSNLAPVKNEIPLAQSDLSLESTNASETKVLMFNSSDVMGYKIDGTGRINILTNGKGIGQLDVGQYLQVFLPKGHHTLKLTHSDLLEFTSDHEFDLQGSESIIEICAFGTGHRARLLPELPNEFLSSFRAIDAGPAPTFGELWDKGYFAVKSFGQRPTCNW